MNNLGQAFAKFTIKVETCLPLQQFLICTGVQN